MTKGTFIILARSWWYAFVKYSLNVDFTFSFIQFESKGERFKKVLDMETALQESKWLIQRNNT